MKQIYPKENFTTKPAGIRTTGIALALMLTMIAFKKAESQVIWNGPTITFNQAAGSTAADQITTQVWLTRGTAQGLYNSKTEGSYTQNVSPQGTEWAYGTLASYATLSYAPWETWNAKRPPNMLNRDAVLHLKTENIYIGIKFLTWEVGKAGGDGGFSYQRTSAPSLPVTLKSFKASLQNNNTLLTWQTATEINNSYFEIQHSSNGVDYTPLGKVAGNGNSTIERSYTFLHVNVADGKHYYRLAQYDVNGATKLSQVVLIAKSSLGKIQVKPNPATSFINLTASSALTGASYIINSLSGQTVKKGVLNNQQLDVQSLAAGQYWLTIENVSGESLRTTFIKK